jgi:ATP-dependent Clp protease ATP-binding subunit ClpB
MSPALRFQPTGTLDPHRLCPASSHFEDALRRRIIGQDEAVQALVRLYQVFRAGLNAPGRPIGNLLFLGPTGVGKTHVVEAAAEILFGSERDIIKVDCAEFQHSHEIAKLIGSPPGYAGHGCLSSAWDDETPPRITQVALANHPGERKLSFLLFDEIEKASDALWQLLLGMLDKATLTLGDNRRVDLSQTIIFMTSNLGAVQITELMTGGMGFVRPSEKSANHFDEKLEQAAIEAARRKFSPEFINRVDHLVVFHPLRREKLEEVLQIQLRKVQSRVSFATNRPFLFRISEEARQFLLDEGSDQRYGARHLNRAVERFLIHPLATLLATDQLRSGDQLFIDRHLAQNCLAFAKDTEYRVPYAGVTFAGVTSVDPIPAAC